MKNIQFILFQMKVLILCTVLLSALAYVHSATIGKYYVLYCTVLYCTVLYCTVLYIQMVQVEHRPYIMSEHVYFSIIWSNRWFSTMNAILRFAYLLFVPEVYLYVFIFLWVVVTDDETFMNFFPL